MNIAVLWPAKKEFLLSSLYDDEHFSDADHMLLAILALSYLDSKAKLCSFCFAEFLQ